MSYHYCNMTKALLPCTRLSQHCLPGFIALLLWHTCEATGLLLSHQLHDCSISAVLSVATGAVLLSSCITQVLHQLHVPINRSHAPS